MKKFTKGFTLIELLVVIAIIGILASVVLASLNTARSKGTDAAIKSNLANGRAQAAIYYDGSGNSYVGVCTAATGTQPMVLAAAKAAGIASVGTGAYTSTTAVCHDSASGWAAMVPLKNPTTAGNGWCVDASGASAETGVLGAASVTCGS
ncbi:MAG TPA: type II secretion system protein [Candidatus Paceibacterota bacterium]|nr:type II secretion system protein [Candidatus Paceibacterota bacterium]